MKWKYKPNVIQIELVQGCNRQCQFCGTQGISPTLRFADIATIKHTCSLIKKAGLNSRILLAGHGEPTLHPRVVEIVAVIRRILPDTMIHMFTNGVVIEKNPQLACDLMNAGLNDLVIDDYSDHRAGVSIASNALYKNYSIQQQGPGTPLFAPKNKKTKRICIVPPIDDYGNTSNRSLVNHCGAGSEPLKKPYQQICSIIFRDIFIRYDGNIAICCNDFRGEYFVCNIKNCSSFERAWFHPRLEAARRFIYHKDRSAVFPCCICDVKPIRAGLLPDAAGKLTMPKPTPQDAAIVTQKYPPLAEIRRRSYE